MTKPLEEEIKSSDLPILSLKSVEHMLGTLKICPVQKIFSNEFKDTDTPLSLNFGDHYKKSGVPIERLSNDGRMHRQPKFFVEFDRDARDCLGKRSIYGSEGALGENYTFAINREGVVSCHLHRILAMDRFLGVISPEMLERLDNRAAELIKERDLSYAPVFLAEKAKKDLNNMKELAKSAGSSLEGQMHLLKVESDHITLPEAHLSHYAEIKKRLLMAGGEYSSSKGKSTFKFPEGVDLDETLEKLKNGGKINLKKDTQFFATPKEVGDVCISKFPSIDGLRFLEPSAGDGALASPLKNLGADVVVVENWAVNIAALKKKGFSPIEEDFLKLKPSDTGLFDGVIMNPPFSKGQDIKHIRHALGFLNSDGSLCAIMSGGFEFSKTKDAVNLKKLIDISDTDMTPIGAGAFNESGTSAKTMMIYIEMPKLLKALHDRNENGAQYGIDISLVNESIKPKAKKP